jgi:hypothetical protein
LLSTILFLSAIFPSIILFSSKSFPHQKAQSKSFFPIFKGKEPLKAKSQKPRKKAQCKAPKAKAPLLLQGSFIAANKVEPWGGA